MGGGGGTATEEGGLIAYALGSSGDTIGVAFGQPYRLVTAAFLHAGLIHLAFNMFALYILGTLLEPAIGTARFVGIYAVSVLSGSFLVMVMDPNQLTVGASGGIFGLMAAAFLIARDRGLDELASQIGFFVIINLVITFSVNNISIGGHIGGLVGGAVAAVLVNMLERSRVPNAKTVEYGVLIALCVVDLRRRARRRRVERSRGPQLALGARRPTSSRRSVTERRITSWLRRRARSPGTGTPGSIPSRYVTRVRRPPSSASIAYSPSTSATPSPSTKSHQILTGGS